MYKNYMDVSFGQEQVSHKQQLSNEAFVKAQTAKSIGPAWFPLPHPQRDVFLMHRALRDVEIAECMDVCVLF